MLKTIGENDNSQLLLNGSKYVLWYDIDMSKTSYTEANAFTLGSRVTPAQPIPFSGAFDGNNHTISHLAKTLFEKTILSATIRNLRLTDATIASGPILAGSIEGASTISNITLSGSFTGNGALANSFTTNTNINTVTNMAIYNKTVSVATKVGGLVGSGIGTISYCSNYGNIYIDTSANVAIKAGGLVGEMTGGSIDHSYNAGAIIVGYRKVLNSYKVGEYYAGGLVGKSSGSLTITNSYNSGIVKAGNNENTSKAYAGGIVAYGSLSKIENSFNEGNIEALGKNPETKFQWTNDGDLRLVQTNDRNVWAYAIGYITSNATITNVYNAENDLDHVLMNGASLTDSG